MKSKMLLSFVLLINFPSMANAQNTEQLETCVQIIEEVEIESDSIIYTIVEEMPQFPGGDLALRKWIDKNTKYPSITRECDIQGNVYVRFVVWKDGSIGKVEIIRGVDPLLDKEAIRVVKSLPNFIPINKNPRNVWHLVLVNFQLQ